MYAVEYSKSAEKALLKLSKQTQERIISVIERARIKPERHFEKLVGSSAHKLRAGNYRIIANIYKDMLCILIIKVGHRRNIYK